MDIKEEEKHLDYVRVEAQTQKDKAEIVCEKAAETIQKDQTYLKEQRSSLKFDELPTYFKRINNLIENYDILKEELLRLKAISSSPYFGAFTFNNDKIYLGRFSLQEKSTNKFLVSDWRSPICSLYYDYELGEAKFKTPDGYEKGIITEKLQFKIENGKLIYCFDTAINIDDEILQKALAENTNNNMKTIIATIQKKQNEIIRQGLHQTTIVQGVAGSGKTSIALHRIAYLLYSNRRTMTNKNILIFSPNKIFSSYISTVLPSLGEKNVEETTFDDIFEAEFANVSQVESRAVHVERLLTNAVNEDYNKEYADKCSYNYLVALQSFLDTFILENINLKSISIRGRVFEKETIEAYLLERKKGSIFDKFNYVANGIISILSINKNYNETAEAKLRAQIVGAMIKMLTFKNIFAIYEKFEATRGRLFFKQDVLKLEDAYNLLYIKNYIFGANSVEGIKHIVIDEMQDYTIPALAVINQMYPVEKTILGDIYQSVDSKFNLKKLDEINEVFNTKSTLITLTKNYRSTYEIYDLACKVLGVNNSEKPIRHGDKPTITKVACFEDALKQMHKSINDFIKCNFESIGILTRTTGEAINLYREMKSQYENININTPESAAFNSGITISAAHLAKGLEFDCVIIYNVNKENFNTDLEKQSLYVAITRALHKVNIIYTGELSNFLNEKN